MHVDTTSTGQSGSPALVTSSMFFYATGEIFSKAFDPQSWAMINGPLATISFLVSITAGIFALHQRLSKRKRS